MFSRGRGRGAAGAGAGKVKREERGRGRSQTRGERSRVSGQVVASQLQAGKRSSSRSPGQSSPARARAAASKTKKARAGAGTAGNKAEDLKAETEQLAGSEVEQENKISAKPAVRKQKLPRVNDNPDAPEVVDVPNMRSSFIAIASPCENGTSQNGTSESLEKPIPEVSCSAKVTFEGKMPLLADEEKCPAGVSPAENGANNNENFPSPAKQKEPLRSPGQPGDSIILIPLNDESEGGAGKNLSEVEVNGSRSGEVSEESEGTDSDSKPDTEGDLLTKMIRENLNKAVNDSDDSFTDGNTDDMKQSLLNAIKNTLKSSNSSRGKSDATDTDGEEVVANGSVTSHADSDLDIDEDETEPKNPEELLKTGDTIDTVDAVDAVKDEMTEDQKDSELIAAAEVEISPDQPSEKSDVDPLKTSGDGINDLLAEVKPTDPLSLPSENEADSAEPEPKPEDKPEDAKVAIPLSELEQGMMLVESVQIEQIEADGSGPGNTEQLEMMDVVPDSNISVIVMDEAAKPKLDIDKTALFSQMNDKFAKDTHAALKNRPVYQKRSRNPPSQTEVKEEKPSAVEPPNSPSSPPTKKKKLKDKTKKLKKDKEETVITQQEEEDQEQDQEQEEEQVVAEEEADSEMEAPTLMPVDTTESNSAPAAEQQEEERIEENSLETNGDSSGDSSGDSNGDKSLPDLQPAVKPEDDSDVVPDDNNTMEVEERESEEPAVEESVKNEEDDVICDTPESRDATPEDQEEEDKMENELSSSSPSSSSSPDQMKSSTSPSTQPICDSPSTSPANSLSQSQLTKSLRKVRLAKKSPSKSSKDKDSSLEEDWSEKLEVEDETRGEDSSSPNKEISGGSKAGTEVFDFTDDEDIPLSNIDLDVFESGSSEGGQLMINIPEPQPTLDHELSKMSSSTSKISPTKCAARKFDTVSPQILSASDAMAAVSALQLSPNSMKEAGGEKCEDGVMSDDTDNSARTPANFSEKGKLGGRKKRRMQESDGAETEDDLENNKKDIRPKRMKNHSGALDAAGRPASAASVTSITSEDRRDMEEIKRLRDHQDGKQTPDSQKEEKNITKLFSTVVPEKASSFKIHPERTCADCCYYCHLKFGMLDTPMHIAQLKTVEKQEFAKEFTGFDADACLCDRCFRFLDRRAQAKDMNGAKSLIQGKEVKEEKCKKCLVRTCNRQVTAQVSKKWLIRLKKKLSKKVGLDWEKVGRASVKAIFPMCSKHNALIEFYSNCGLCKRKLTVGGICTLGMSSKEVEEMNVLLREDHIPADLKENNFVCKLCKTFCGIKQKSLQPDYLKNHKTYKAFYKDYRRKLYIYLELGEDDKSLGKIPKKLFKVSQSGDSGSCKITISAHTPDMTGEKKKRKEKEILSPSDESHLHVVNDSSPDFKKEVRPAEVEKCSVSINFDLNTKKLWQDLHYPYGSYTSFFRHLILLEKYWRSGDLTLANNASVKSSSYLKSVQNRIASWEGQQFASKEDLSALTRPDLAQPPAPQLIHVPGEAVLANLPPGTSSPKMEVVRSPDSGMILKIPKVPTPRPGTSLLSPPVAPEAGSHLTSPAPKIRVRQDLMAHLGLVARTAPNIVEADRPKPITTTSHLRAALTVTPVTPSSTTPNLAKLLSEGPSVSAPAPTTPDQSSPHDPVPLKSSNSQLFKSSESSGAIPLTFNNSIAEVLAAANKAKANKSREPSPKPEITITAKSSSATSETGGHPRLPATINSPSPSGGGLSIMKRSVPASTGVSPLSNMTKLLAAQAPGLPPHIIAQQSCPKTTTKVMSKPPGPVMSNLRPVQISGSKPGGIQTVNKKSLNTVLDRLGGLTTATTSSLVQQLQAPPMTSRPGGKSKGSVSSTVSSSSSLLVPSVVPPIAQPMVQFPPGPSMDPATLLSQSLLLTSPNPAAAQAALMMAGLNGLSQAQAQQAMQELLQQQQQLMATTGSGGRMRGPPPLKNMSSRKQD